MVINRADHLRALALRLDRLTVSRRDPEKFFEDRSTLARELRELADAMRPERRSDTPADLHNSKVTR